MTKIFKFCLITLLCLPLLIGCKEKSTTKTTNTTKANPTAAQSLPSISLEEMKMLYEQCDYIDFIFYNMDFSMSVNTKSNVQRVVTFVDKAQPTPNSTCPPTGRIIFQKDGGTLIEADMHYSKACQHLVFYKDNKKVYANRLTPQGIAYFQQIFSQVKVEPITPQDDNK